MSDLSVQVIGLNETINKIISTSRVLPVEIRRAVRMSGLIVERRMKLNLSGPAHLKYTYRDAGTKRRRMEALITGEDASRILTSNRRRSGGRYSVTSNNNPYPGYRTPGGLRDSVHSRSADSGYTSVIGPTAAYAPYLEYGTRKMKPYRFVAPTFEQSKGDIIDQFHEAVRRSIQ